MNNNQACVLANNSLISKPKHMLCVLKKDRLTETVLLSTQNACLNYPYLVGGTVLYLVMHVECPLECTL